MRYLNPYQLLGFPQSGKQEMPGSEEIHSRVKAVLLLMDQGEWILPEWMQEGVTEMEIRAALEDLKNPQISFWNWEVYHHGGLLNFLNTGFVAGLEHTGDLIKSLGPGFVSYISPFFAERVREMVRSALFQHQYRDLVLLTFRHGFMVEEDQTYVYQAFEVFLEKFYKEVAAIDSKSIDAQRWIARVGNRFFVQSFNNLPANCAFYRSRMAILLVQFAGKTQREGETQGAVILVNAGLKLKTDQVHRQQLFQIRQNLLSFSSMHWDKMVETAKTANLQQLSGPTKWKFDIRKHWLGLVGLSVMLAAIITAFVLMMSGSEAGWEKSKTVIKSQRDFYSYRQWKAYDDSVKQVQLKLDGPRIFTMLNDYTAYSKEAPSVEIEGSAPVTGSMPYAHEPIEGYHPGRLGTPVWFVNQTEMDAVFFPVCFDLFSFPQRHFYIRAGDSLLCHRLPAGEYGLLVYSGEQWNENALNLTPKIWKKSEQVRAGAFEQNASILKWPPGISSAAPVYSISSVGERNTGFSVHWTGEAYTVQSMELSIDRQIQILDLQKNALDRSLDSAGATSAPALP